ncbi:conserved oligomeric Golgi complex subunit 7 [Ctenocephalides felis]|uniref:conserved oligomeric Golgi complex subunit 7 n=1 Tax=Ctenocephalides felis TaxID=7515 RepID=UPI000E6E20B4|nr:conserved oligomeric Golgi complex subunit 7 [Ctenocephalides felis]XP_026480767.1 conserved oligomeric Golgi complex subunit 7 [Ctenocephalides felis]
MDLTQFAEEDFDPVAWINGMTMSDDAKDRPEDIVNNLLGKIQSCIKQVSQDLEETSQQILVTLPNIIKDTKLLQLEAETLKGKMISMNDEIAKVQDESGQCMSDLEELDKLKTELESAKQSLMEADKWTNLVSDIEELFEQSQVDVISERLSAMAKSLDMMGKHLESSDKATQLQEFRNRLEALTSPQIMQAFSTGNIEQSKRMVSIFTSMDRLQQLLNYYKTYHKTNLSQRWLEFSESSSSNISWLEDFYDILVQHCREQVKWTSSILSSEKACGYTVVALTISELLQTLDPSLNSTLQRCMKTSDDKLLLLSDAVACSKKFANNLLSVLNNNGQLSPETQLSLATSIYSHLVSFVAQYPSLESTNLTMAISAMPCVKSDVSDTVQNLSLNNSKVLKFAEMALSRCDVITQGCGCVGLARILEAYLISYCDQYTMAVRQLERCKTYEQDWNTFQLCISLFQSLGQFYRDIIEFDKNLISKFTETDKKLSNDANIFHRYKLLLLSKDDCDKFDKFIRNLQNYREDDGKKSNFVVPALNVVLFESFYGKLKLTCRDLYKVVFENVLAPIGVQMEGVVKAPAWCDSDKQAGEDNIQVLAKDLPDYSYSPQEYITQIGQYLLTLPQHLEPFLLNPNENLAAALNLATDDNFKPADNVKIKVNERLSGDILLAQIADATCQAYSETLLTKICRLNDNACRQLAVDIEYLESVLEELGLKHSLGDLVQWPSLLRCSRDNYSMQSSGSNPRLVSAVRQMREITSTM